MSVRFTHACSIAFGSILPSAPSSSRTFVPLAKNSGAPHSATSTCASSWQSKLWYDWQSEANESELAEVPLKTKKTSQLVSKTSRIRFEAFAVQESFP